MSVSSPPLRSDGVPAEGDHAGLQFRLQQLPTFARELIAGGVAGGLAKTCVAPLERTKILFQTGRLPLTATVPGTLLYLWRSEGVHGLFKGNTASVARIVPYAAIHFSAYEYYRRLLLGSYEGHVNPGWDLLAGSAAGATAVLLTYPMDLVRAQLAWQTEVAAGSSSSPHQKPQYPSIRRTISDVIKSGGMLGLFRGITPTVLGILPYAGLKFYVYQSLKHTYREWTAGVGENAATISATGKSRLADAEEAAKHATAHLARVQDITSLTPEQEEALNVEQVRASDAGHATAGNSPRGSAQAGQDDSLTKASSSSGKQAGRLPVPVMLLLGAISGLVGQTATYPLDVVRRRMQVHGLRSAALATDIAAASASGAPAKHTSSGSSSAYGTTLNSAPHGTTPSTASSTASSTACSTSSKAALSTASGTAHSTAHSMQHRTIHSTAHSRANDTVHDTAYSHPHGTPSSITQRIERSAAHSTASSSTSSTAHSTGLSLSPHTTTMRAAPSVSATTMATICHRAPVTCSTLSLPNSFPTAALPASTASIGTDQGHTRAPACSVASNASTNASANASMNTSTNATTATRSIQHPTRAMTRYAATSTSATSAVATTTGFSGCALSSRTAGNSSPPTAWRHATTARLAAAPTMWQVCKDIVREGGYKALYRGLSINYMKVVPSTAIGFTVYDALKAYLDLKNNL